MRRHIIGTLSLVLFAVAAVAHLSGQGDAGGLLELTCWRLGAVMAVWWLAYPDLSRLPAWLLAVALPMILMVMRWPKLLWLIVPLVIVLAIIRPRVRRR